MLCAAKQEGNEYLHVPTVGIDGESIVDLEIVLNNEEKKSSRTTKIRVELVDFAGQVEYYIGHQLFLSDVQCLYVIMAEYKTREQGLQSWLPFLKSMFSSGTRIPVMLVCSKVPTAAGVVLSDGASALMSDYCPPCGPFETKVNGSAADARLVLYDLKVDGERDKRTGPKRMKELIVARLAEICQSTRVPLLYNKAMDGVQSLLNGEKIVPRSLVLERIKKQHLDLQSNDELVGRTLRHMRGCGMISYSDRADSKWIVLEPLSWLPRLLALFVRSSDAKQHEAPIPTDEFGFVALSVGVYDSIMSHLELTDNKDQAVAAVQLLVDYGLARIDAQSTPNRLYLPFTLKPLEEWKPRHEELAGHRVVGRQWKCCAGTAFPPGFFCQLQLRAVNLAGDSEDGRMSLLEYPHHSNVLRVCDDKDNSGVLFFDRQLMLLVWGPSPTQLFDFLVFDVDAHVGSYPGLTSESVERWTMCPVCLKPDCQPKNSQGRPVKLVSTRSDPIGTEGESKRPPVMMERWSLAGSSNLRHGCRVPMNELVGGGCKW